MATSSFWDNFTNPLSSGSSLSTTQSGLTQSGASGGGVAFSQQTPMDLSRYTPTTTNISGNDNNSLFGGNTLGALRLGLGGIQTLGSLWNAYAQNSIAKKQLALSTRAFETNLANNTKTYNTALEDRIRARINTEGGTTEEADAYLEEHSL